MNTLKDLIISLKSRKGESTGTTKRGAYWRVAEPVKIRTYGGDGIGQSAPNHKHLLEFRHFRTGEVRAIIHIVSYHQNGSYSGGGDAWHDVSDILDCSTIEDVIVALKGQKIGSDSEYSVNAYSDSFEGELSSLLSGFGLPDSSPAPDDAP